MKRSRLARSLRLDARSAIAVAAAATLIMGGAPAGARTITVAKDGSGEFSIIQDALAVAAPGDSVLIGPGRYSELHRVASPLEDFEIAVRPFVSNLTIRGAGTGSTIIGPFTPIDNVAGRQTVGIAIGEGILGTKVGGVSIENLRFLVSTDEGVTFIDSDFIEPSLHAIALFGADGTTLLRCRFRGNNPQADAVVSYVGERNPNTTIEDCEFEGALGRGIMLEGGAHSVIRRTTFNGLRVGVQLTRAAPALIVDCAFEGVEFVDVVLSDGSDVELTHSILGSAQGSTLRLRDRSRLSGSRNLFRGSQFETLELAGGIEVALSQCHILNGGGRTVFVESTAQSTGRIDLRNNYWGTADLDQIAAWIVDGNDPPPPNCWYCPAAVVEYEPIQDGPVSASQRTFGGLKSRYGPAPAAGSGAGPRR